MSANLAACYIDAKEFGIIKSIIDSSILKIIRTVPEWKEDTKIQILKSHPLFKLISE